MKHFFRNLFLMVICSFTYSVSGQTYEAHLTGSHEPHQVLSNAQGTISATLISNQLVVSGSFNGLTSEIDTNIVGGAHIHTGLAGQSGGVVFVIDLDLNVDLLGATINAAKNTFTLTPSQIESLEGRGLYINVHTLNYAAGELRGQLLPQMGNTQYFYTKLLGSWETQPIMTHAKGALVAELNGNDLTVSGSFAGLEGDFDASIAGGSHLHLGMAGENGGVQHLMNVDINNDLRGGSYQADSNTFTLSAAQRSTLLNRGYYANIHTLKFPGGELRGQLYGGNTLAAFRAFLTGTQEVPFTNTKGSGQVLAEYTGDSLFVTGFFGNLSSEVDVNIVGGSHLHNAPAGQNGGVEFVLNALLSNGNTQGVYNIANNGFEVSNANVETLMARGYYLNIHTLKNGPGELRGQLLPEAQYYLNATLSGTQEVPVYHTNANGRILAEVDGNHVVVSGSFNGLASDFDANVAGGAHLHNNWAGANGGVELLLNTDVASNNRDGMYHAADNMFMLRDGQLDSLRHRRYYANIHTTNAPGGELRGQLLPEANMYFTAILSGDQEVNPANTNAMGTILAEVKGNMLTLSGGFQGLQSDLNTGLAGGAHIHPAFAGSGGPVQIIINPATPMDNKNGVFNPADNMFALTDGAIDTLMHRMNYINIHSMDIASGEIRGQLLPFATRYFIANLNGNVEVPFATTEALGALLGEWNQGNLVVTGSFNDLNGDFDASIAGGSHLHKAIAGENGGVNILLNAMPANDLKSAVYMADSNTFAIDMATANAMVNDSIYANIHTTTFAPGEIRGQMHGLPNFFPTTSDITAPMDGVTIDLNDGEINDPFTAEWDAAMDNDNDALAYVWQLATDMDFNNVVMSVPTASELMYSTSFGAVDSLLQSLGVDSGEQTMVYHRVLSHDGSLVGTGNGFTVTINRFNPQTNSVKRLTEINNWMVYPNPATDQINVVIETTSTQVAKIGLTDINGKLIYQEEVSTNGNQLVQIPTINLQSGVYFVRLHTKNSTNVQKIVIQ